MADIVTNTLQIGNNNLILRDADAQEKISDLKEDLTNIVFDFHSIFINPHMLPDIGNATYTNVTWSGDTPTFDNTQYYFVFRSDLGGNIINGHKYLIRLYLKATNNNHNVVAINTQVGTAYNGYPIYQAKTANGIYECFFEFTSSADLTNPRVSHNVQFLTATSQPSPATGIDIDFYDVEIIDITGKTSDEVDTIKEYIKSNVKAACENAVYAKYAKSCENAVYAEYVESIERFKNKKVLVLGDSIMTNGVEVAADIQAILSPSVFVDTAVSGATWTDYSDTPTYDGNPVMHSHNNVIGNQVQKVINNHGVNPDYDDFDICLIAAGTNDDPSKFGWIYPNWNEVTDVEIESYFTGDTVAGSTNSYIDVDTVDRTKLAGAMRYAIEKIYALYPDIVFFISLPIQCGVGGNNYLQCVRKDNLIRRIATRMALNIIETQNCGIYGQYDSTDGNGKYLMDGVHPNSYGSVLEAKQICRAIMQYFMI